MSWKYQLNDSRASQAQMASGLRAASRAAKFSARRGTGGGFGNLGFGMYKGNERSYLSRIPYAAGSQGQRTASFLRTIAPETKYFDVSIDAAITTTGTTWAATEVPCDNYVNSSGNPSAYTDSALIPSAVGSGYGQVNGNRYKLKRIRVRGIMQPAEVTGATVVGPPVSARLLLVMDTQPNGAQAQGEDIMQGLGATPPNEFSFRRVGSTSGRFRILKDERFAFPVQAAVNNAAGTTVSYSYPRAEFDFSYAPKMPIQVNITSANATPNIAGLVTCNIFLLAFATNSAGVSAITVTAASRAYYCD